MKRKAFIYLSGILILILAGFFVVSIFDMAGRKTHETLKVKSSGIDKLRVSGLEYTHNQFGRKVFSVRVEEFRHKKRKIGPLTINPIKELELNNVHIEIFHNNSVSEETKINGDSLWDEIQDEFSPGILSSILNKTFNAKELGFISRVRINNLEIAGFKNGQEEWTLFANRAEMGIQQKHMALKEGVSLTNKAGQRLATPKLEWLEDRKVFYAPGSYILKDSRGERASANTFFTLSPSGEILPSR